MITKQTTEQLKNEFFELKKAEPKTLKEWLGVFSEAQPYLQEKLKELKEKKEQLKKEIVPLLQRIVIEKDKWFHKLFIKIFWGDDFDKINKEIIEIDYALSKEKPKGGILSQEQIARARQVEGKPIYEQIFGPVRGTVAKCPYHKAGGEKHPSLNIKGNYFYCYACGEKGDAIKLLMDFKGQTFKEAVLSLQ